MATDNGKVILTRWWWVRHAPVPDGGKIYGQGDLDCDCTAVPVFEAVARALPPKAVWVTSSLKRTHQTAAAIVAASGGRHAPSAMPRYADFAEQHLGDWQGQDRDSVRRQLDITPLDFWLTRGGDRAPNGESFPDLANRVAPLVDQLTATHAGRDIVAVTHGGTIRAALQHALGLPGVAAHTFVIDNCSVTALVHLRHAGGQSAWRCDAVNARPWL